MSGRIQVKLIVSDPLAERDDYRPVHNRGIKNRNKEFLPRQMTCGGRRSSPKGGNAVAAIPAAGKFGPVDSSAYAFDFPYSSLIGGRGFPNAGCVSSN